MQQPTTKTRKRKRKHYLAEWADAYGFGPAELIKATNADKSNVSRWLAGSEPSVEYMEQLGRLFKVPPERLYHTPPTLRVLTYTKDDPAAPEPIDPDAVMTAGSETGVRGVPEDASQQIDVTAGMGAGGMTLIAEGVRAGSGLTFSAEVVSDFWRLPPTILGALHLKPRDITIMPVQGNSMAPTLLEGDFVFVDTRHRIPSPDGVYALEDEYGGIIVKTLRAAEGSAEDGPMIDVVSDNPAYPIKRKRAEDVRVIGRVVRRFSAVF